MRRGALAGGGLLVAVYAVMMMLAGGGNLAAQFANLNPRFLFVPLLFTLFSYITMSLSYEGIARAAGSPVRFRDMLRITLVANTANYVLPTGGLSGFALRLLMFTKKGIGTGRAVLISFTQTLLTNVTLMIFIVYGFVHLMLTQAMTTGSLIAAGSVIVALSVFLGAAFSMVYARDRRVKVLAMGRRFGKWVLRRTGHHERQAERMQRFFGHIDEGMEFFASQPRAMIAPFLWILLDWVLTVGVLYAAFYSVGRAVEYNQVAVAFSVGIVLTIISFVPAGAGVLEGSMATTFMTMGIPFAESVLPIFIFRVCFYVVPAVLSLFFARSAFAEAAPADARELI